LKRIAVLGGTRFFGKCLVNKILENNNYIVDVYSRNKSNLSFDRGNKKDLEDIFSKQYDIIIDNICFGSSDAKIVNDIFLANINWLPQQYIFTSTSFVYKEMKKYDESISFTFKTTSNKKYPEISYEVGKKESEYIFQNGVLSDVLLILRPPYIIGKGDHTKRLSKMISLVKNNSTIEINNNDFHKMSFVDVELLTDILIQFIDETKVGIFNVANESSLTSKEIYQLIEKVIDKDVNFVIKDNNKILSPYSLNQNLCLDISKLRSVYNKEIVPIELSLISIIRNIYEKI